MEQKPTFVLRLYSANKTEQMEALVSDLTAVIEKHFPGACRIELIDVIVDPEQAARDEVFVTPALVKSLPEPAQRIIGDLSQPERVLTLLGIL